MTREKKEKNKEKGRNSPKNSVSLNTNQGKVGDTFLGYKTKNINQLWDWNTLEDVVFK